MKNINDCHEFNVLPLPEQIKLLRITVLQRLRVEEPTLRDQFAMSALQSIVCCADPTQEEVRILTSAAYRIADSMLESRGRR